MATKKEIAEAKEKAIEGGFTSGVADNIFRMQMGAHGSQDTKGSFRIKDQKTMAMSTMYQTPDPEGELGTLDLSTPDQTVTSIGQTEVDIPASRKVEQFAADPQAFFNTMAKEAAAKGWTGSVSDYIKNKEQQLGYRGRTDIIEDVDTTVIPGEKRTLNAFDQFSQGFDSVGGGNKGTGGGQTSGKTGTGGMADTFSALDTRQAGRKAIVEARKLKRARIDEAKALSKVGGTKDSSVKDARKALREARKQNRQDKKATRDAFIASPNISGSDGFGLKTGMAKSNQRVSDAKAALKATKKSKKGSKQSLKQQKQEIRAKAASQRVKAMEKIAAQGEAQRAAAKNPATTKEFDPSSVLFMTNKSMSFRNKKK